MNTVLRLTNAQRAELFRAAALRLAFDEVIVEKDFWVCWTLQQLFTLPNIGEHLIFKGGTSLSKVWRAVARFSEDIDVSLTREWLGFTGERDPENAGAGKQQRGRIEELSAACATKVATELLPALRERATQALGAKGWVIAVDPDDAQTLRFTYPSALPDNAAGAYVRREVKIECGARSDTWPAEEHVIVPYSAEVVPAVDDANRCTSPVVSRICRRATRCRRLANIRCGPSARSPSASDTRTGGSRRGREIARLSLRARVEAPASSVELRIQGPHLIPRRRFHPLSEPSRPRVR